MVSALEALKYDAPLSIFAFNFHLSPYSMGGQLSVGAYGGIDHHRNNQALVANHGGGGEGSRGGGEGVSFGGDGEYDTGGSSYGGGAGGGGGGERGCRGGRGGGSKTGEWGGGRGGKGVKKSKLGIDGVKVKLAPLTEEQKAVKRAKKVGTYG